jgi:hypothetical protein
MKQETPALRSFIRDYGLEKPNGVICFTANILFQSKRNFFQFSSSVHIITISNKHLDVIYLLNPEIDSKKINTMYSNVKRFKYSDTRRFHITGRSRFYGPYTIFISPVSPYCEAETLAELNAKQNN